MTSRLARTATLAFVCAAMSATVTGSARAAAPDLQGWWTADVPGAGLPLPTPPDVPADGLLVQGGGAASPTAYAALVYQLGTSTLAGGRLTLTVSAGSASVPGSQLQLCPLTTTLFIPAQGGAEADAPAYSCRAPVTGIASQDGHKYTFAVGDLVVDGVLAVAVVPTAPTDRVVFAHPGSDALPTATAEPTAGPSPTAPSGPASCPSFEPTRGLVADGVPAADSAACGTGTVPLLPAGRAVATAAEPAPHVAPMPSTGTDLATLTPASNQHFGAAAGRGADAGPRPLAVAALAVGLLLAATAWGLAQGPGLALADAAGGDEEPSSAAIGPTLHTIVEVRSQP